MSLRTSPKGLAYRHCAVFPGSLPSLAKNRGYTVPWCFPRNYNNRALSSSSSAYRRTLKACPRIRFCASDVFALLVFVVRYSLLENSMHAFLFRTAVFFSFSLPRSSTHYDDILPALLSSRLTTTLFLQARERKELGANSVAYGACTVEDALAGSLAMKVLPALFVQEL